MLNAINIDDMTDAQLAKMVRESVYAQHTRFGDGPREARFLIVLAVPYGPDDEVHELGEAIYSFAELVQADDWKERSFQVYDHRDGSVQQVSAETLDVDAEVQS